MKFIISAHVIYWPTWLLFKSAGYSFFGMLAGVLAVIFVWSALWRLEFGTWKLWKDGDAK